MAVARVPVAVRLCVTGISIVLFLGLAGCTAMRGYPATSYDPPTELKTLAKYYAADVFTKYDDPTATPETRKAWRNEVLNGRIRAIDIHFTEFQQTFYQESIRGNVLTDFAVLVLGGTGAVTGSASTKAALSATSAAVVGTKSSIDKNVYFEKTLPVLIARMTAERKKILARLQEQMALPDASYSLHQGLVEVEDYYFAGTIPGAIQQVSADAGKVSQDAGERIEKVLSARTAEHLTADAQKRVDALLAAVTALPAAKDAAIIAIATTPPATTPEVESVVTARDPTGKHKTDAAAARDITKMRISLMPRDAATLEKWEKALATAAAP